VVRAEKELVHAECRGAWARVTIDQFFGIHTLEHLRSRPTMKVDRSPTILKLIEH
jgi:hypothetical protein